jgi:hypothetical protein
VKNSLSAACDIAESVRQLSQGYGVLTLLPLNFYLAFISYDARRLIHARSINFLTKACNLDSVFE